MEDRASDWLQRPILSNCSTLSSQRKVYKRTYKLVSPREVPRSKGNNKQHRRTIKFENARQDQHLTQRLQDRESQLYDNTSRRKSSSDFFGLVSSGITIVNTQYPSTATMTKKFIYTDQRMEREIAVASID